MGRENRARRTGAQLLYPRVVVRRVDVGQEAGRWPKSLQLAGTELRHPEHAAKLRQLSRPPRIWARIVVRASRR